jgi:riboflavin synthase
MFTGIVTDIGEIVALTPTAGAAAPDANRLRLRPEDDCRRRLDRLQRRCLTVVGSGVDGGKPG